MVVDMDKTTPFKHIPVCIHKVKVTAVASVRFPQLVDISVESTNSLRILEVRSAVPEFDDSALCTTAAKCKSAASLMLAAVRTRMLHLEQLAIISDHRLFLPRV